MWNCFLHLSVLRRTRIISSLSTVCFAGYVLIQRPAPVFKKAVIIQLCDNVSFWKQEKLSLMLTSATVLYPAVHCSISQPLHIHTSFACHLFKPVPLPYNLASLLLFLVVVNCHWDGGTDPNIYFLHPWSVVSWLSVLFLPWPPLREDIKIWAGRGDREPGPAWGS